MIKNRVIDHGEDVKQMDKQRMIVTQYITAQKITTEGASLHRHGWTESLESSLD